MEYPSNDAAESQTEEPFAAPENSHVSTESSTLSFSQFQKTHTKKRKAVHTELTTLSSSSSQFPKTHTKKCKAVQETSCSSVFLTSINNGFLSTALTLFDKSWTWTYIKTEPFDAPPESPIAKMRFYTKEDEQEEKRLGVSTRLNLLFEDQWKIRKTLTNSDVCVKQNRLLVLKDMIENHVLPFLGNVIESSNGLSVAVWDQDTESSYDLVLKQWESSKGYVFIKLWHCDFVIRRSLKVGDEVGMYWDGIRQRFNFSLLQRAAYGNLCQSFGEKCIVYFNNVRR